MSIAIKVENVSKQYRLGEVGTGSLAHDVNRFWYKLRGKEDPYLKIGESNDRTKKGASEHSWALHDVSFEVKQGEVLGIIGRNGAGKSTLLKILSRVTTPTTGEVKVKGRIASLLEVGTGFHPELTGRENIYINGAILGMRKHEITRKLDEIIEFSGVERYIDTPVKRYSSGMYVRLAFAVAAHLEPEILIVDEILAVGDAEFQKKCLGKMKDVAGQGRTVLFVSHNMTAVRRLCSQSLILGRGKTSGIMTVDKAIDYYHSDAPIASDTNVNIQTWKRIVSHGNEGRLLFVNLITSPLIYGRPGKISIGFHLCRHTQNLSVGIGLNTLEGQRVLTLDSDTHNPLLDLDIGLHILNLELEFWPLPPGFYVIDSALIVGTNYLDAVADIATWEVLTDNNDTVTDRGGGAVRPRPTVTKVK